jgi:hypothetical protein
MIRPANMRTVRGIAGGYSVSAVRCVEDIHLDHYGTAASGSGMDAPDDLPAGSIKAWFNPPEMARYIGHCQRTVTRNT